MQNLKLPQSQNLLIDRRSLTTTLTLMRKHVDHYLLATKRMPGRSVSARSHSRSPDMHPVCFLSKIGKTSRASILRNTRFLSEKARLAISVFWKCITSWGNDLLICIQSAFLRKEANYPNKKYICQPDLFFQEIARLLVSVLQEIW